MKTGLVSAHPDEPAVKQKPVPPVDGEVGKRVTDQVTHVGPEVVREQKGKEEEVPLTNVERRVLMYLLIKSGAIRVGEQTLRNVDVVNEHVVVTPEPQAKAYTIAVKTKE